MQPTYIKTILKCFSEMDIEGLRLYLKDEYSYEAANKDVFLDKMEAVFQKHRNSEDSELVYYPGACAGETCENCGNRGYRFVGNRSKNYIDLLFETVSTPKFNIFQCYKFYPVVLPARILNSHK